MSVIVSLQLKESILHAKESESCARGFRDLVVDLEKEVCAGLDRVQISSKCVVLLFCKERAGVSCSVHENRSPAHLQCPAC